MRPKLTCVSPGFRAIVCPQGSAVKCCTVGLTIRTKLTCRGLLTVSFRIRHDHKRLNDVSPQQLLRNKWCDPDLGWVSQKSRMCLLVVCPPSRTCHLGRVCPRISPATNGVSPDLDGVSPDLAWLSPLCGPCLEHNDSGCGAPVALGCVPQVVCVPGFRVPVCPRITPGCHTPRNGVSPGFCR